MAATMLRLSYEQEELGKRSEEERLLQSRALTGRSRGAMTEEQKRKISRTLTGRTLPEEHRQNLTGRAHTACSASTINGTRYLTCV